MAVIMSILYLFTSYIGNVGYDIEVCYDVNVNNNCFVSVNWL